MDTKYHETGPRHRIAVGVFPAGNSVIGLTPCIGFLHSYIIDTPSSIERVRVSDCNGALISDRLTRGIGDFVQPVKWLVDTTPDTLNTISDDKRLRIPFALDAKGIGALADMSSVTSYRLEVVNAAEPGIVYADYWPLLPSRRPGFSNENV